jgi:hypothetical protein
MLRAAERRSYDFVVSEIRQQTQDRTETACLSLAGGRRSEDRRPASPKRVRPSGGLDLIPPHFGTWAEKRPINRNDHPVPLVRRPPTLLPPQAAASTRRR